jgi:hypothetical protein
MFPAMKQLYLTIAAPFLLSAAPAVDDQTMNDVRCFVVLAGALSAADADGNVPLSGAYEIASIYYLGRLDARSPPVDLEKAIAAEARTGRHEANGAIIQRCIRGVGVRIEDAMNVAHRLGKRGI